MNCRRVLLSLLEFGRQIHFGALRFYALFNQAVTAKLLKCRRHIHATTSVGWWIRVPLSLMLIGSFWTQEYGGLN
jgi:hypothetical protein